MGALATVIWAAAMHLRKLALGRCGFWGMGPACAVSVPDAGFCCCGGWPMRALATAIWAGAEWLLA